MVTLTKSEAEEILSLLTAYANSGVSDSVSLECAQACKPLREGLAKIPLRNVEMIRGEGVRLIRNSIPREVRAELREGIRRGELGHLKKDGLKPEAFFHPDQRAEAEAQRLAVETRTRNAGRGVLVTEAQP